MIRTYGVTAARSAVAGGLSDTAGHRSTSAACGLWGLALEMGEVSVSRTSRLIAPAFEHATVADAMRAGIISCSAGMSVRAVADMMASYHVHAIVVEGVDSESSAGPGQGWGIVSDVELAGAAARGKLHATAGELVGPDAIVIDPAEPLKRAAELMSQHGVSHLIVSTAADARPVGIISTLDLAVVLAWGRD